MMRVGFWSLLFAAAIGCGVKPPSPSPSPLGGPINAGGTPDPSKSKGDIGTGGAVNSGGTPDLKKTNGKPDVGGPVNAGGAPDLSKSRPPTMRDAGSK